MLMETWHIPLSSFNLGLKRLQNDPVEEWPHSATFAVPSMEPLMKEASVEKVTWLIYARMLGAKNGFYAIKLL